MTARRFRLALGLIVVAAAALRIGPLATVRGTPFYHFAESWVSSDMHANLAWADRMAAGAWLDSDAFRPQFGWQERIAAPETWRRWLGTSTYYQPPLYTYLLAFVIRAAGSPDLFRVLQTLLGTANAGLVGILAWRMARSRAAGLAAAALAAAYAPWIFYDAEILRGTLALTTVLLVLLALHESERLAAGVAGWSRRLGWLLAGGALGVAYLADSSIVTFVPAALLWCLAGSHDGPERHERDGIGAAPAGLVARLKSNAPRAAALAAGLLAALAPLVARNLVAGAGPFSVTTRAPLAFVMGNAPEATPVGASFPPRTAEILAASDYGLLSPIRATIAAHEGRMGDLLELQRKKLAGILSSYEVPDNPSFYYAEGLSPVLGYGLRFSCVVGLGLAGLIVVIPRRGWGLLHLYAASLLVLFLLAHVVSRYRQPLLIPIFVLAGTALVHAFESARARRWRPAAATLAGAAAISLSLPYGPPPGYRYHRPAEFLAAAGYLEGQGNAKAAGLEIRRGIALSLEENGPAEERIVMGMDLAALYVRNRLHPQALSALGRVLDEEPEHPGALALRGAIHQDINQPWQALQFLIRAVTADPDNAEVHARLGRLYWLVFETPASALGHLKRALELDPASPAAARNRALMDEIRGASGAS